MPSLQEELSKIIPLWTENGPDNPDAAPPPARNSTEKILRAVQLRPFATSGHVTEMLTGEIPPHSVTSMLNQLCKHGYLQRTDERPTKYTRTNKPYEPADSEWRKKALEKANAARRMKLQQEVKTKPLRIAAAPVAPKEVKDDPVQMVLKLDVLTAKRVYVELRKVFSDV